MNVTQRRPGSAHGRWWTTAVIPGRQAQRSAVVGP